MKRVDAQRILLDAVGGQTPELKDVIEWGLAGWKLAKLGWLGSVAADPDNAREGDVWFNTADKKMRAKIGEDIYETAAWTIV